MRGHHIRTHSSAVRAAKRRRLLVELTPGRRGKLSWFPSPPPCFCHEYQNKGVRSSKSAKNIKPKDLSRMIPNEKIGRSGLVKAFVLIFLRARPKSMDP